MTILEDATIPELPNHYRGKVRDCYDLEGEFAGTRLLITTDRLSAFDRYITCIPEKGRILTKLANWWFRRTADICPNHVLSMPDPNVLWVKKLTMFPVEIVVRDYLAGSTDTSVLQMYKKGMRSLYGHTLPDGLRDHDLLPTTIITPTSKSNEHDEPLTGWDVVNQGLVTIDQWIDLCRISLELFAFASSLATKQGLILADTKYEFGLDENGVITLADEIHTPDSSRYWHQDTFFGHLLGGTPPDSFDKDMVRHYIRERCDPYNDPIPEIPKNLISSTTNGYMWAYEKITDLTYVPLKSETPIIDRIRLNLQEQGIF